MSTLKQILAAARRLLQQRRAMAALAAVYASLLAALLFFVVTKEATWWQIILTLVFAALAPALFFILQAMIINYARGEDKASILLKRSLEDSCKLAVASLPLALLALIIFYLLNKVQSHYPAPAAPVVHTAPFSASPNGVSVRLTPPLQWPFVALSTLRLIIFGIALPLIAIHLWSATLREGMVRALKGIGRSLARAFAPEAVRAYAVGLVFFGLVPYLLLFMHTPASRPSVAFGLFVARLLLVFVFTLLGWVLTVGALAAAENGKAEALSARTTIDREQPLCEA